MECIHGNHHQLYLWIGSGISLNKVNEEVMDQVNRHRSHIKGKSQMVSQLRVFEALCVRVCVFLSVCVCVCVLCCVVCVCVCAHTRMCVYVQYV